MFSKVLCSLSFITTNSGPIEQETNLIRIGAVGDKTIFFDFDETLVDTSELRAFRQTAEGRDFIADHPDQVNTRLIDTNLLDQFNKLAQSNLTAIATNSSKTYTISLLNKHGFSTDIPIYYNLHKPCHDDLSCAIMDQCDQADDALYIGDSASDIIAAHGCRMPSVAVTWGKTSTPSELKKAEPTQIANTVSELKSCIHSFINEELIYEERFDPENYIFINNRQNDAAIVFQSLYTYYPVNHRLFRGSSSNAILRFKDIKNFTKKEVNGGVADKFFHAGQIRRGPVFINIFFQFYEQLSKLIDGLNLKGKSYVVAAPNASPEYCYKLDVNQIMANKLNQNIFKIDDGSLKRILFRVFPKRESHLTGSRDKSEHNKTIGVKKDSKIPLNIDNLIIFDDVSTTCTQLICLANIMKDVFEFEGKIIGLTLGQTTDEYF